MEVLLLDEVSMLDCDIFSSIATILNLCDHNRKGYIDNNADEFGDCHILLFGPPALSCVQSSIRSAARMRHFYVVRVFLFELTRSLSGDFKYPCSIAWLHGTMSLLAGARHSADRVPKQFDRSHGRPGNFHRQLLERRLWCCLSSCKISSSACSGFVASNMAFLMC